MERPFDEGAGALRGTGDLALFAIHCSIYSLPYTFIQRAYLRANRTIVLCIIRCFGKDSPRIPLYRNCRDGIKERQFVLRAELDAIDIKDPQELQGDGRMTNVELADRSASPRHRALAGFASSRDAGIIENYHAMLNSPKARARSSPSARVGLKRSR